MVEVLSLERLDDPAAAKATEVLEGGGLVLLPNAPFALDDREQRFLDPAVLADGSKNVSRDPDTGKVRGARLTGDELERLGALIVRYAQQADAILDAVAPSYRPALQTRRTSFRPGPVETRVLSARKDDRRLHIDAFPANPVQGRRILRVFTNVHPRGQPRVWELGEETFETFARSRPPRFRPGAGVGAWAQARLGITRGRRTAYDAAMLELHDRAKLDGAWQASTPKRRIELPAGSSWVVYTDSVLHAALTGQHALEKTYLLPVETMQLADRSPLRVLEWMAGRPLV